MSYRTYVNGKQIFGNNESYQEWFDFVKSQGIEIDDEGCYDGYITNFMDALKVIEKITLRLTQERTKRNKELRENGYKENLTELFDWSNIPTRILEEDENDKYRSSLFDELMDIVNNGYAFLPYTFFLACKEKLENITPFSMEGHLYCYKLKEDEKIHINAR